MLEPHIPMPTDSASVSSPDVLGGSGETALLAPQETPGSSGCRARAEGRLEKLRRRQPHLKPRKRNGMLGW